MNPLGVSVAVHCGSNRIAAAETVALCRDAAPMPDQRFVPVCAEIGRDTGRRKGKIRHLDRRRNRPANARGKPEDIVRDEPFPWNLLSGAKGVQFAELGIQSWKERRWVDVTEIT